MGIKSLVKQMLTEKENKRYAGLLADRKCTYGKWLADREREWSSYGVGAAVRDSGAETIARDFRAGAATGDSRAETTAGDSAGTMDFVLILASRGEIADYAIKNIGAYFAAHPEIQVLYGDEDVWEYRKESAGVGVLEKKCPWFKPDWSPDLLDSCCYFGSLTAVRRNRWNEMFAFYERFYPGQWQRLFGSVAEEAPMEFQGEGTGEEHRTGGSPGQESRYEVTNLEAYEKWLFDCVSAGYRKNSPYVGHIPQILFHACSEEEQGRFFGSSEFLQTRRRSLMYSFFQNYVEREDVHGPLVSVIIPSKDQPDILRQCVESVKPAGADLPCEIIVVDNGSEAENRAKTEKMLREEAAGINGPELPIRYIYRPMEFNFSAMCNIGAEEAKGELLLFLNDDVVLQDGCVEEMAARAARMYTGAVGLKLLYPDTGRIQHAGITNLPMGPVHKLQSMKDDKEYYGMANRGCRNFLGVTAACLMVEKEKFQEAGGFAEELRVAFNDVDLCFKLYEAGYHNVCLNHIYGYHYESLSRGDDESEEKLERLLGERAKLYERHPGLEGKDPYYSPFLNRDGLDVRIAPAYLTAGNQAQNVKRTESVADLENCREDRCLMIRVETAGNRKINGWSVILGDNNACYDKILLLRKRSQASKDSGVSDPRQEDIYGIQLEGQYRPDLEENMPDQTNVALGGFWLELAEDLLPAGTYQIGIYARNRVTGLRLRNWSNRFVEL